MAIVLDDDDDKLATEIRKDAEDTAHTAIHAGVEDAKKEVADEEATK